MLYNKEILDYLLRLKFAVDNNLLHGTIKFHPGVGICNNNGSPHFRAKEEMMSLMMTWPKSTGVRQFPIPHPNVESWDKSDKDYLEMAAVAYRETLDVWKGDYGKLRMELLEYMIDGLS